MGNSDLRDLAALQTIPPEKFSGETVAIDAHNWLYKYITGMVRWVDESEYTTENGAEVPNLVGMLRGVPTLLQHDITPVFVFDGAPDDMKAEEIERRREERKVAEAKLESAREEEDVEKIKRMKSRTQRLTPEIHESSRGLLDRMGIQYVEAPGAGEAQAAHMAQTDQVDSVMSEDYDALLFAAPRTIRQFKANEDAELMQYQQTLSEHDITHEQLIDIAILCGTDYNDGVYRVGPKTALSGVKEHGSAAAFLGEKEKTVPDLEEIRELFLEPPVSTVGVEHTSTDSIDPNYSEIREYVSDEWELPEQRVENELERLRETTRKNWF